MTNLAELKPKTVDALKSVGKHIGAVSLRAEYSEEVITPALARTYLDANRSNRPLSRQIVAEYVHSMLAGEWLFNGEAIKFDKDGELVDGQHRLAAVERANKSIVFLVIRGLDPEVFKTIDTGKKRSAGDVLAIRGVKNPNAVGGALRLLHRTLADEFGLKRRISNTVLDELRERHPRFIELAEEADHAPYSTNLLTTSGHMFGFYMAVNVNERKARAFFRQLSGRREPDDPIQPQATRLRERLTSTMDELVKPAPKIRLAWLIEAWNRAVEGKPAERFSRILTELPRWDPLPEFKDLR
jgi:hypothetical protein